MPEEKAIRVANYIKSLVKEVGVLAHACGVKEPRELRRWNARVVMDNGKSIPLSELYPDVNSRDDLTKSS